MEAPEKIFLSRNALGVFCNSWWLEPDKSLDNVEYIRKDAFIENVCDWLSDTLQTVVDVNIPSAHHVESIPALGVITQTEFIKKFKKEIEYLLD